MCSNNFKYLSYNFKEKDTVLVAPYCQHWFETSLIFISQNFKVKSDRLVVQIVSCMTTSHKLFQMNALTKQYIHYNLITIVKTSRNKIPFLNASFHNSQLLLQFQLNYDSSRFLIKNKLPRNNYFHYEVLITRFLLIYELLKCILIKNFCVKSLKILPIHIYFQNGSPIVPR